MREHLLKYLSDPLDSSHLELTILLKEEAHVVAGFLSSATGWYPIIDGIPRILLGELKENLLQNHYSFFHQYREQLPATIRKEWQDALDAIVDFDAFSRHQKKTAERFAYEWKYIYQENNYEKQNFLHFLSPFLKEEDLKGQKTLDIGCGSGRFTKWAAQLGTEISFGTDLGETVTVAYEMTKDLPNVCIVQADIYHMPFSGVFDISYSIGVLHHLPAPEEGFLRLPSVLKSTGKMLIWVYNRKNNARAIYLYEPVRDLVKNLPAPVLFKLSYIPAIIAELLNTLTKILDWYGFKKLAGKVPFSYYANFPFNMKLNDSFDILATPKSNYYYAEAIEEWFQHAALKNVQSYEHPEAGITCIGTRE